MMPRMFEASIRRGYLTTFTSGLIAWIDSSAESTLGMPMRWVEWITWRCRLERSTSSSSTMPSVPTPAAARYSAAGEPSPPAPISRTLAASSLRWPTGPTSGRMMWRAYLRAWSSDSAAPLVVPLLVPLLVPLVELTVLLSPVTVFSGQSSVTRDEALAFPPSAVLLGVRFDQLL